MKTSEMINHDSTFMQGYHIIEKEYDMQCPFCLALSEEHLLQNDYVFAKPDEYPVTEGHTLLIPKRHFADYFDITKVENNALQDLMKICRKQLLENDSTIVGFNIGINVGKTAGQTIFHCHVHLIPRRKKDHGNSRGGVRGIIAHNMQY